MSRCRSCGARVVWAVTGSGKRMPLDVEAREDGTFVLIVSAEPGPPLALYAPEGGGAPADVPRYASHFATCPEAATWRR